MGSSVELYLLMVCSCAPSAAVPGPHLRGVLHLILRDTDAHRPGGHLHRKYSTVYEIRWEQFLRRCRLKQL